LELVNASSAEPETTASATTPTTGEVYKPKGQYKGFAELLPLCSTELKDLWDSLRAFLPAVGDDVQEKHLKHYVVFRRLKNFACAEVHPHSGEMLIYTRVDPKTIHLQEDFTRDVTDIGHYGPGDLEIRVSNSADLEHAKPVLLQAYKDN